MLNGLVGYQLLDDGTPVSIGLLLISALIMFVGTGYIALDTGFGWTGFWNDTLSAPNQAYALYTMYQLAPLVFMVVFFLLEAFLVVRVLGERKPMRMFQTCISNMHLANCSSLPARRGAAVCYWADISVCHQRAYLHRVWRQDQRRTIRDAVHAAGGRNGLGVLVEHYRR
jgi:hypothetical protein